MHEGSAAAQPVVCALAACRNGSPRVPIFLLRIQVRGTFPGHTPALATPRPPTPPPPRNQLQSVSFTPVAHGGGARFASFRFGPARRTCLSPSPLLPPHPALAPLARADFSHLSPPFTMAKTEKKVSAESECPRVMADCGCAAGDARRFPARGGRAPVPDTRPPGAAGNLEGASSHPPRGVCGHAAYTLARLLMDAWRLLLRTGSSPPASPAAPAGRWAGHAPRDDVACHLEVARAAAPARASGYPALTARVGQRAAMGAVRSTA